MADRDTHRLAAGRYFQDAAATGSGSAAHLPSFDSLAPCSSMSWLTDASIWRTGCACKLRARYDQRPARRHVRSHRSSASSLRILVSCPLYRTRVCGLRTKYDTGAAPGRNHPGSQHLRLLSQRLANRDKRSACHTRYRIPCVRASSIGNALVHRDYRKSPLSDTKPRQEPAHQSTADTTCNGNSRRPPALLLRKIEQPRKRIRRLKSSIGTA
jgi:hypothetical protein